jgi:hypothetical protein
MKKFLLIPTLAILLAMPFMAIADNHEEKDDTFIYATYFYCKSAGEEKADELVKKNTAPVYDAAVADGTIMSWGWLSHHTGGKWRRIQYHVSDTVDGLFAAQETIGKRVEEAMDGKDDGFSEICYAHDDYIWKSESGSGVTNERGAVGLSVYHVCDLNREERADEIVANVFAPVYEKAIESGVLKSWGWSSHQVGGKYRRLGTMTAASHADLFKAWDYVLTTLYDAEDNSQAVEFSDICGSHSDYIWNLDHVKSN